MRAERERFILRIFRRSRDFECIGLPCIGQHQVSQASRAASNAERRQYRAAQELTSGISDDSECRQRQYPTATSNDQKQLRAAVRQSKAASGVSGISCGFEL